MVSVINNSITKMPYKILFKKSSSSKKCKEIIPVALRNLIRKKIKICKLSNSQITKESCLELFQEYMQETSIHGLKYPVQKERSLLERYFIVNLLLLVT